jgi:hypothetical protein
LADGAALLLPGPPPFATVGEGGLPSISPRRERIAGCLAPDF